MGIVSSPVTTSYPLTQHFHCDSQLFPVFRLVRSGLGALPLLAGAFQVVCTRVLWELYTGEEGFPFPKRTTKGVRGFEPRNPLLPMLLECSPGYR